MDSHSYHSSRSFAPKQADRSHITLDKWILASTKMWPTAAASKDCPGWWRSSDAPTHFYTWSKTKYVANPSLSSLSSDFFVSLLYIGKMITWCRTGYNLQQPLLALHGLATKVASLLAAKSHPPWVLEDGPRWPHRSIMVCVVAIPW